MYRFWRDLGYAIEALVAGAVADLFGLVWSIHTAGLLTFVSGVVVLLVMKELRNAPRPPDVVSPVRSDPERTSACREAARKRGAQKAPKLVVA